MSQLLQANLLNSSGLKHNSAETVPFSDQDIVSEAIATTEISCQTPGTVMWKGQSWQAYCEENISIRQGQPVVVLARYGRSLLVQSASANRC